MTNVDNTIHFSDDDLSDEDNVESGNNTCRCKGCGSEFLPGDKGCSALKELCQKCHAKENADLLALLNDDEKNHSTADESKYKKYI
jgi:hypothetical protein